MEYAIVKTGGKQYKVSQGSVIQIDKIDGQKDDQIILDEVLLFVSDGQIKLGKPFLLDVKIKAKILSQIRGEKIRVGKFKAKAKYRRTMGFRAFLTNIQVEKIKYTSK